ncbi:hypothetical protein JXC34_07400 [Candidatus Woesearchaeota archaeon]|nr:hypothetical protein [Candidatus Woesearchaeota archaeon]
MKKRLTQSEEFEIMKLVLDKFLWMGFGIMAYGFYTLISGNIEALTKGISFMIVGAVVLMIFMALIIKEYEIVK